MHVYKKHVYKFTSYVKIYLDNRTRTIYNMYDFLQFVNLITFCNTPKDKMKLILNEFTQSSLIFMQKINAAKEEIKFYKNNYHWEFVKSVAFYAIILK